MKVWIVANREDNATVSIESITVCANESLAELCRSERRKAHGPRNEILELEVVRFID